MSKMLSFYTLSYAQHRDELILRVFTYSVYNTVVFQSSGFTTGFTGINDPCV